MVILDIYHKRKQKKLKSTCLSLSKTILLHTDQLSSIRLYAIYQNLMLMFTCKLIMIIYNIFCEYLWVYIIKHESFLPQKFHGIKCYSDKHNHFTYLMMVFPLSCQCRVADRCVTSTVVGVVVMTPTTSSLLLRVTIVHPSDTREKLAVVGNIYIEKC